MDFETIAKYVFSFKNIERKSKLPVYMCMVRGCDWILSFLSDDISQTELWDCMTVPPSSPAREGWLGEGEEGRQLANFERRTGGDWVAPVEPFAKN